MLKKRLFFFENVLPSRAFIIFNWFVALIKKRRPSFSPTIISSFSHSLLVLIIFFSLFNCFKTKEMLCFCYCLKINKFLVKILSPLICHLTKCSTKWKNNNNKIFILLLTLMKMSMKIPLLKSIIHTTHKTNLSISFKRNLEFSLNR